MHHMCTRHRRADSVTETVSVRLDDDVDLEVSDVHTTLLVVTVRTYTSRQYYAS